MTLNPELLIKHQSLSRRVASLPAELDDWIDWAAADRTLEKNFSQIEALDHFMRSFCEQNERKVSALDPAGDVDVFLDNALVVTANTIKIHSIWNFFRSRLELRFVPQFQKPLLMADLISHDCYIRITDRAEALRIIPKKGFREYPLTGLAAEFSPATWPRGWRPPALQNHNLPIPVIDLPWDHLTNPWELLTIAHEVGHDVDEDLGKLSEELQPVIADEMYKTGVPEERIVKWQQWTSEIFADLVAILLTGPAFVSALSGLLTMPRRYVRHISPKDEHPPHYLRVFINTALVRRLGLTQSADDLEASWKALYGEPGDDFSPYLPDIDPVLSAILDTSLKALQDWDGQRRSLGELVTFTPDDQVLIHDAATKLSVGDSLGRIPIRYVISASQLAFEQEARTGDTASLEKLAQHTRQTIIELAPPAQLPAGLTSRTRQRLDDLAHLLLGCPLDDFGIQGPVAKEEIR